MILDRVLALAQEVLDHDLIHPDRPFVTLGGDSVQAIGFADRLRDDLGVDLDVVDVLGCPSLRELGTLLDSRLPATPGGHGPAPGIRPEPHRDHDPVTPVQRGLYLLDRLTARPAAVVPPAVLWLPDGLDPEVARAAFTEVVTRHEILRTVFSVVGGDVVGVVRDEAASGFGWTDARSAEPAAVENVLREVRERVGSTPVDLGTGPPARLHLVLLPGITVGLLTLHHIVSDDYSASIVEDDLRRAHDGAAGLAHGSGPTEGPAFQYRDYAAWLERWCTGPRGRAALDYWGSELDGRPDGRFFPDPAHPGGSEPVDVAAAALELPLPADVVDAIRRARCEHRATTATVLAACVRALLSVRTGRGTGTLGVAMTTRDTLPGTGHIGPYVNTVPIAVETTGSTTFRELVADLGATTLRAFPHRLLPVERISAELRGGRPLFDVGFTLQKRHPGEQPVRLPADERSDSLGVRLVFAVLDDSRGITVRIRYRTAHADRTDILGLHHHLAAVALGLCTAPDAALGELPAPADEAADFALDLDV